MNREEAIGAFQDLIASLESQNTRVEPPLTGCPILNRIITPGSIFTRVPPSIHTPSAVIIVFTTTIAVIRGSK